ncbi:transposase [Streptomyces sp. NPDC057686]|uniref:transposase n=1 Tax=Streptomyces sp. NPDC057686 TaxID=3346212 RepID=UPI0036C60455
MIDRRVAGLRLMAIDGARLQAAGTEADEAGLGRLRARPGKGPTGYPLARIMVLADRGLPGAHLWQHLAATGADLLWRIPGIWKLPVEEVLPDGSWISTVRGGRGRSVRPPQDIRLRVIEYSLDIPGRDKAERYRLITTLMDPETAPAAELAALYGERWEVENTLAEQEP